MRLRFLSARLLRATSQAMPDLVWRSKFSLAGTLAGRPRSLRSLPLSVPLPGAAQLAREIGVVHSHVRCIAARLPARTPIGSDIWISCALNLLHHRWRNRYGKCGRCAAHGRNGRCYLLIQVTKAVRLSTPERRDGKPAEHAGAIPAHRLMRREWGRKSPFSYPAITSGTWSCQRSRRSGAH